MKIDRFSNKTLAPAISGQRGMDLWLNSDEKYIN
jgi:hypothetical protein